MPWHTRTRRSNQWYDTVRAYVGEGSGPHSSTLAWKIPWMEEPGRLQSMGSQRVGHDWTTSVSLFTLMHWRRKWRPTPVFLPGEPQGRGSLVGCRRWGRTEWGTTEATQQQQRMCMICPLFFNAETLPMAQRVKNLPAMQELQVPSWGGEDPLEEEMATHFSIFFLIFLVSF